MDVSNSDIESRNLILIGDKETNSVIGRIAESLPIRVMADHVSLAGNEYQGNALGYEFIAPNPLQYNRYVVVIGTNRWVAPKAWKLHPSKEGFCDYFVFDLSEPSQRLKDAGYFEAAFWQRPGVATPGSARSQGNEH